MRSGTVPEPLSGTIPRITVDKKALKALPRNKRLQHVVRSYLADDSGPGNGARIAMVLTGVNAVSSFVEAVFPNPVVRGYCVALGRCLRTLAALPILNTMLTSNSSVEAVSLERDSLDDRFREAAHVKFGLPRYADTYSNNSAHSRMIFENIDAVRAELGVTYFENSDEPRVKVVAGVLDGVKYAAYVRAYNSIYDNSRILYDTYVTSAERSTDTIFDRISKACLDAFVQRLNTRDNYIICNEYGFVTHRKPKERVDEIYNLPYGSIKGVVADAVARNVRTSIMFIGDPGQGKSTTLFQLMYDFPELPCIWLRPSHAQLGLDFVYSIISSIGMCLLIFDDLESCDVAKKNDLVTTELLSRLEGNGMHAVIVSTVNEPKLVHPALKRSRRLGDHVYLAEYPTADAGIRMLYAVTGIQFDPEYGQCIAEARMTISDIASIAEDVLRVVTNKSGSPTQELQESVARRAAAKALLAAVSNDGVLRLDDEDEDDTGDSPLIEPNRRRK